MKRDLQDFESVALPLCWSEGMMLSPQHFQQNDVYWEQQLQLMRRTVAQHSWGIIELEIDHDRLLESKEIAVKKLKAILPDGLFVNFVSSDEATLNLALDDDSVFEETDKVYVHLVIPKRVAGAASNKASIKRFLTIDSPAVLDDNTGEDQVILQRLGPKLKLVIDKSATGSHDYIYLPLMVLENPDKGHFRNKDYCPPLIGIGYQKHIWFGAGADNGKSIQSRALSLAYSMRHKARQLAGYVESEDVSLGRRINDVHSRWIRLLTKLLPELELLAEDDETTPKDLYKCLTRLAGLWSELDPKRIPVKPAKYNHRQIQQTLEPLFVYLEDQLKLVNTLYSSLRFEEREGIFSIKIDKAWQDQDLLVELLAYDNVTKADMNQWFNHCRIASHELHKQLQTSRVRAAEIQPIDKDHNTDLQSDANRQLFLIKADNTHVIPGQQLVIVCMDGNVRGFKPKTLTLHLPHKKRNKGDDSS